MTANILMLLTTTTIYLVHVGPIRITYFYAITLSPCAVDSLNPSDCHSQPSPCVPISRRLSQLRKVHPHCLVYLLHPSLSWSSFSSSSFPTRQHHLLFHAVCTHHMSKIHRFLSRRSLHQCHLSSQVSYFFLYNMFICYLLSPGDPQHSPPNPHFTCMDFLL